ncbi:pyruvate formate lyase family protein [Mailhella massiliensis]|uniref:pyruvate formate lyase family protein n=1 Tax=Mailhella massiliensis TaxID=1903261 RepID=UPI00097D9C5B|nr:pyruvate formate lyase family protein [Mailhella massiliensis]
MNQISLPAPYRRPSRLARRISRIAASRPRLFMGRALYFTESMRETENLPLPLRWAKALVHVLDHVPVELSPDEMLAGSFGSGRCGIFYPELDSAFLEDEDFAPEEFLISGGDMELARTRILPYWHGRTYQEHFYSELPPELKNLLYINGDASHPAFIVQETATVRHSLQWALDYDKVLRRGFRGIAEEAEKKLAEAPAEKRDFYEAVLEICRGVRRFAERFAALAEEQALGAATEEFRKERLALAERCRRVPWEPAESFADAVQAQWFTQMVSRMEAEYGGNISNGRMDQYLRPLYEKDIASGVLTQQKAREYLDDLWCHLAQFVRLKPSPTGAKIYEDLAHWEFTTLGGRLASGGDATNALSFLILRSASEFPLDYPYLGVRIHKDTPEEFLREICRATQKNGASPVLFNDETIIARQTANGATAEEARDYCGSGYSEARLINKDTYFVGATWLNLPAVLEMALHDGYCSPKPSRRTGLSTGPAEAIGSFEQLMELFRRQLLHILDMAFRQQGILERLRPRHIASPLLSCLHDLCMKHGVDMSVGAVPEGRSIGGFLGIIGFATVVDSLAAIDTLVFRQKKLSLRELLDILAVNFEGHEDVRQLCLNSPKYGNRIPWVDDIGRHIDRLLLTRARSEVNSYGGRGEIFYVPVKAHIAMGRVSGATADGRFAGNNFSFGVTPSHLVRTLGPTVSLSSETAVQNPDIPSLGARVMFSTLLPGQICGEAGVEALMSLLQTWCRQQHWFLRFQILTPAELTVLRNSPYEYNSLFLNVPGLNAQGYSFPSAAFSCRCPLQKAR